MPAPSLRLRPSSRRRGIACALLLALFAGPLAAAQLDGQIEVENRTGRRARRGTVKLEQAVVWFVPDHHQSSWTSDQLPKVETLRKEFVPRIVRVPVGGKVRFPNRDPILHNVFSVTTGNAFDLGLYSEGSGREVTFQQPGVVQVFCNVHHSMVAYVVVLDTPYSTQPAADGSFSLRGLPTGKGTLNIWQEQTEPWQLRIEIPHAGQLAARLAVTKPRVPQHLNKHGKRYQRRRRSEY